MTLTFAAEIDDLCVTPDHTLPTEFVLRIVTWLTLSESAFIRVR
jgi:hypothetical protein